MVFSNKFSPVSIVALGSHYSHNLPAHALSMHPEREPRSVRSGVPAVFDASASQDANWGTPASPACDTFVARKLAIAREILLRDLRTQMAERSILGSPDAVRDWLTLRCAKIEHEVFLLLHLDARHRLIEAEEIFRGTLTPTAPKKRP